MHKYMHLTLKVIKNNKLILLARKEVKLVDCIN